MSFKTIEKIFHSGALKKGVAIGAHLSSKRILCVLRFGSDILEAMNWGPGCYLGLAYGTGHHAGKLRIGLDELSGFKLQRGAPRDVSKALRCSRIGDGKKHKSQSVQYKIAIGYLYINLPDWARPMDK